MKRVSFSLRQGMYMYIGSYYDGNGEVIAERKLPNEVREVSPNLSR